MKPSYQERSGSDGTLLKALGADNFGIIEAQLQIINEKTNRWQTLGTCLDTPNARAKELQKKKYHGKSIWITTMFGRTHYGLVK